MIIKNNKQKIMEKSYEIIPSHYLDLKVPIYEYYHINYLSYLYKSINILKRIRIKNLLDFGCGDGRLLYEIKDLKINYTGIDISKKAIDFARVINDDGNFICADLTKQNIKGKIDCISAIEVIEHLSPKERIKVFKRFDDILSVGGFLLITVPTPLTPINKTHFKHFFKKDLDAIVGKNFKSVYEIGHNIPGFNMWIYSIFNKIGIFLFPIYFLRKFLLNLTKKLYSRCSFGKIDDAQRIIVLYKKLKEN